MSAKEKTISLEPDTSDFDLKKLSIGARAVSDDNFTRTAAPSDQALWVFLYFSLNLALTLQNKAVLSTTGFHFPWTMTALHQGSSFVGAAIAIYVFGLADVKTLKRSDLLYLLLFSVLYTVNIAMSNVSLNLVTLSFHQTLRSINPVFTAILNFILLGKKTSGIVLWSLLPVVIGVVLATAGEYGFTFIGFLLTIFGVLLATVKGIVTNMLMVGDMRLHAFDLLLRMAPLAAAQALLFAWLSGEQDSVIAFFDELPDEDFQWTMLTLLSNGAIAFFLCFVSFTANKKTGPLTISVCGNIKQALSITLGVWWFQVIIPTVNAIGIFVTICGGFAYTYASHLVRQAREAASDKLNATR